MAIIRTKLINRDWLIRFEAPAVTKMSVVQVQLGSESLYDDLVVK